MFYLLVFLVLAHNLVRTSFSELIFSSPKHRAPKLIEHLARALLALCQLVHFLHQCFNTLNADTTSPAFNLSSINTDAFHMLFLLSCRMLLRSSFLTLRTSSWLLDLRALLFRRERRYVSLDADDSTSGTEEGALFLASCGSLRSFPEVVGEESFLKRSIP